MPTVRVDPRSLRRTAREIAGIAQELRTIGRRVTDEPVPRGLPPERMRPHTDDRQFVAGTLDRVATGIETDSAELVRRAQFVEQIAARRYLLPRGRKALILKARLLAAARARGVKIPRGFRVDVPYMGQAARELLRRVQRAHHVPPNGVFDHRTRLMLRPYVSTPTALQSIAYPGDDASRQKTACWLAAHSAGAGAPPVLLTMMALTESGARNLSYGDADSVGFFQIRPSTNYAPAGFGIPPQTKVSGQWWVSHPEAQAAWATQKIRATRGGTRNASLDDPAALGRWAQDIERSAYPDRYAQHYREAKRLVDNCRGPAAPVAGASQAGGSALAVAAQELQRGVHESGTNTGPRVHVYQSSTGAYNAPWCASFVTWCLQHSGHRMPGGGWAAVSTWVNAARAGRAGLHIVSAAEARPGDIVCFDWGGGSDFGGDGHIGFLNSTVRGGAFSTIEGNYHDAVGAAHRTTSMANVVFIRVEG